MKFYFAAKKILKKEQQKKARKSDPYLDSECAPSPESSGYGSGSDHNDEVFEGDGHSLLHAFNHDHGYIQDGGQVSLIESSNNAQNFNFETNRPLAIGHIVQNEDDIVEQVPGSNLTPPLAIANILFDSNGCMLKYEPVDADESITMVQASVDGNLPMLQMGQACVDGNLPVLQIDQAPASRNLPILQMDQASPMQVEDADFGIHPPPNGNETMESPVPDNLDSLDIDGLLDSFIKNPENSKLVDDVMKDLGEDLFHDPEECSVKREITSPSGMYILYYSHFPVFLRKNFPLFLFL